jgi:hypothetical protein
LFDLRPEYPEKLAAPYALSTGKRVRLQFTILDKQAKAAITVHQA